VAATVIAVSSTALRRQRTDLTDLSDLIYFLFTRPLSGFKLAFSLLLFRNNRFRLTSASARKRHAESCMRDSADFIYTSLFTVWVERNIDANIQQEK